MEIAKIAVTKNRAIVLSRETITSGMVGATVTFEFDDSWNDLSKTYVWKADGVTLDDLHATGKVPHELLIPGAQLTVGVYGVSEEKTIPTLWADLGMVMPGADPSGDESADPSLPVWAQIREDMAPMQGVVDAAKEATEKVPYLAEGVSQNYYLKKPGWKRILVNTRIQNGFVALSLSRNHVIPGDAGRSRTFQNLGLMFTGFVDYPGKEWNAPDSNLFHRTGEKKPVLYQMYNNCFGEEIGVYPERRTLITRVRIGYPKPTAENAAKLSQNPINCYLDVYCDFEDTGDEEPFVQFMVNYMGKTYNHDVVILTEDTEAEDIGIHGEELEFHYFSPSAGYAQDIPNTSRANILEADTVAARNVVVLEEKTAALNSDAVLSSRITEIQIPEGLPAGTMYLHARRKYNLLSNPLVGKGGTRCGITWSCGTDGGFTLDGTAVSTGIIPLMNTTAKDLADAFLLTILLPPGSYQVYGLQVRYTKYAADGTVTETGNYVTATTSPARLTNTDGYTLLTRASVLIEKGKVYDPKKKLFPYICKKDGREADIDVSGNVPTINGTAITDPTQWYSEPPTAFTVPDLTGAVLLDFAGNTAWADGADVTAQIPGNVFHYMSMVKDRYANVVNSCDSLALWAAGSGGLPPQGTVRWETDKVLDKDGDKVDKAAPYSTASAPFGLYGCMEDGTVQRFYTTMKAEALKIPRYTATGNLRTNTPKVNTDAANKAYVDGLVQGVQQVFVVRAIYNNSTGIFDSSHEFSVILEALENGIPAILIATSEIEGTLNINQFGYVRYVPDNGGMLYFSDCEGGWGYQISDEEPAIFYEY